jgi:hypothetical protein
MYGWPASHLDLSPPRRREVQGTALMGGFEALADVYIALAED